MRAAWYERNGPAHEVLKVGELPDPQPGPGERPTQGLEVVTGVPAVLPLDEIGRTLDGVVQRAC